MELNNYIVYFVLAGTVILAMFLFANGFAADNGVPYNNSVGSVAYINSSYNNLNSNLSGLQTTFNSTYNKIQTEDFVSSTFTIIFTSLPNAVRLGMNAVLGSGNIVLSLVSNTLGIPVLVISIILALIIFILLLRFYRVTRTGFE